MHKTEHGLISFYEDIAEKTFIKDYVVILLLCHSSVDIHKISSFQNFQSVLIL